MSAHYLWKYIWAWLFFYCLTLGMNLLPKHRWCLCVYFCSLTISSIWTEIVALIPEQLRSCIFDFLSEEGKRILLPCVSYLKLTYLKMCLSGPSPPQSARSSSFLSLDIIWICFTTTSQGQEYSHKSCSPSFPPLCLTFGYIAELHFLVILGLGVTRKLVLANEGKWLVSLLGPSFSCEPVQSTLLLYCGDPQCFRQQTLSDWIRSKPAEHSLHPSKSPLHQPRLDAYPTSVG